MVTKPQRRRLNSHYKIQESKEEADKEVEEADDQEQEDDEWILEEIYRPHQ